MFVNHHIKYKEIHGVDEVVLMDKSEHRRLHARLRREGKCNISSDILRIISSKAKWRRIRDSHEIVGCKVNIRKEHYHTIVSMKQDPTAFINRLLGTTFVKTVTYTPVDDKNVSSATIDEHQKITTKKQTKK